MLKGRGLKVLALAMVLLAPLAAHAVTFTAGTNDSCGGGTEASSPSAGLAACCAGSSGQRAFDETGNDRNLLHTFDLTSVTDCVTAGTLTLRARPDSSSLSHNDNLTLFFRAAAAPGATTLPASQAISMTQVAGGVVTPPSWTTANYAACDTDYTVTLLPQTIDGINSLKSLDVRIADDTIVDYLELDLTTAAGSCSQTKISKLQITDNANSTGAATFELTRKTTNAVIDFGTTTVSSGNTPAQTATALVNAINVGGINQGAQDNITVTDLGGGMIEVRSATQDLECRVCEGNSPCAASAIVPPAQVVNGQTWDKAISLIAGVPAMSSRAVWLTMVMLALGMGWFVIRRVQA